MPEVCIVVPTLNEADNLVAVVDSLTTALVGEDWELIFVDDDSSDGTSEKARKLALRNPRVRVLQRIGRRGLSSACIEGMLASAAPVLAVMDGDLQHDPQVLPRMIEKLRAEELDLVVGSRNVEGGSMGDFPLRRRLLSHAGRALSDLVCRCRIEDPMSGFFVVDRRYFESAVRQMSGVGFKILVDLVSSAPRPPRLGEVPYRFGERRRGESKLEPTVLLDYAYLIADKLLGRWIPFRFVLFGIAGLAGVGLHLAALWYLMRRLDLPFGHAQAGAAVLAMTSNFLVNNWLTFRDRRRRGWGILAGLLSFYAFCSVGAVTNVAVATFLYARQVPWLLAGALGTIVGSVWNFSVTSLFTWRADHRPRVR